jgi:hypothetical protein
MALASPAIPCPKCGSHRVRPSRVRSLVERIRRAVTERQPYRCHGCNYRAWYVIQLPNAAKPDKQPADLQSSKANCKPLTTADLDQLDNR